MSTIRVVNLQHTDATVPNIVLESDGTSVFASGITISGATTLTVSGTAEFASGTAAAPKITFIDDNNTGIYEPAADTVAITTAATERLRVDSSGRLLVGTSTSPSAGDGQYTKLATVGNTAAATGDGRIVLGRGLAASGMSDGQDIGGVYFTDNTGATFAKVTALVDGTPGTNDHPGRLVFSTSADGASTPTERLRIGNDGSVQISMGGSGYATLFRYGTNEDNYITSGVNGITAFRDHNGGERMRIDSAGRLLIGTSSPAISYVSLGLQGNGASATNQATLAMAKGSLPSGVDQELGRIEFFDNSGNSGGQIVAISDAAWTSGSSHATSLTFSTTQSGASSGTEQMRITSGGIVKILGTSESLRLEPSSGTSYIGFWDGTSTAHYGFVGAGNKIITGGSSSDLAVRSQANLVFSAGGAAERMRVLSSGGLTFNGDTAAANALDDYEEGSWTPTVIGTTTAGTASYSARIGDYTKVGNMVTVLLEVGWGSGTGTGFLAITGLPFTTTRNNVGAIGASSQLTYTTGQIPYVFTTNTAIAYVGVSTPSSGAAQLAYDSAGSIYIVFSYMLV